MNDIDFIMRILKYFDGYLPGRDHSNLEWNFNDEGRIRFCTRCNDLFWWATADTEEITPENFHLLDEAWNKLPSDDDKFHYFTDLFACLSRKMRPQRPALKNMREEIRQIFLSCGPERDPKEEG